MNQRASQANAKRSESAKLYAGTSARTGEMFEINLTMPRSESVKLYAVAQALGWTVWSTLRRFKRAGWCTQFSSRCEWEVSRQRLWAVMPTVAQRLEELEDAGLIKGGRGGCRRRSGTR